jgi:hypothetical protein
MTNKEANKILATLKATYPAGYKDMQDNDFIAIVGVWSRVFKDHNYIDVSNAVDSVIATNKTNFPPSPGLVMDQLIKITSSPEMTEMEAWQLVFKAIKNSAWHSKEEFNKLPLVLQNSVGSPEMLKSWAEMPVDTIQSVVQSNFMRTFRAKKIQDNEHKALPSDVKNMMKSLSEGLCIE